MKKFNQGRDRDFSDRGSSRRSGGFDRGSSRRPERGSFGGGSRGGSTMMHKAVCFECGKDCEVPFRPTGGKPVFCSNCFENKGGSDRRVEGGFDGRSEKRFERSDSFKPRFSDNKFSDDRKPASNPKMDEVIAKLDKIIRLLSPVIDLKKEESMTKVKELAFKEIKSFNDKKPVSTSPVKSKIVAKEKVEKNAKPKTGGKLKAKAKAKTKK